MSRRTLFLTVRIEGSVMYHRDNQLLTTDTAQLRSFPKFLPNANEPEEASGPHIPDEASKELEAQMLHSWYQQKKAFRRYASRLRRH